VEVHAEPALAYTWTNLYLCCVGCQNKLSEDNIPRDECLDPCDQAVDPADHLTFVDEEITPKNDSVIGAKTIQKYQLDRGDLNLRRSKQIKRIHKALIKIQRNLIDDGRTEFLEAERQALRMFSQRDRPYSLMSSKLLEELNI